MINNKQICENPDFGSGYEHFSNYHIFPSSNQGSGRGDDDYCGSGDWDECGYGWGDGCGYGIASCTSETHGDYGIMLYGDKTSGLCLAEGEREDDVMDMDELEQVNEDDDDDDIFESPLEDEDEDEDEDEGYVNMDEF